MKIAIATVFRNANYGAVLQAYALSTVIEKLSNKNCYLIDYRRKQIINMFRFSIFDVDAKGNRKITKESIIRTIKQCINPMGTVVRFENFEKFRKKYMNISEKVYFSNKDIDLNETDILFLGSDQIWNPDITKGFNDVYFGNIEKQDILTASYAASLGRTVFSKQEKIEMKDKLKHVDIISVREEEGAEILRELTDKPVSCVPDPTVLIDREHWASLGSTERKYKNKYVMIYMLHNDNTVIELARTISKLLNCEIILFNDGYLKRPKGMKLKKSYGPAEFISFIKHAEYVVTNSFHGTIFSVIFNKNFYTVPNEARGNRMINFCKKVGLENRVVYSGEQIKGDDVLNNINYKFVNLKVEELRGIGLTYIEHVLKGVGHE